ncbi:MAG: C4-dicarboxylate ABC transporter [Draconibacterium sp.]|nr:MAG: C4-dicarboxylate ABC transporter [Draconibacterium sp.]
MKEKLKYFPITSFAIIMGLTGLAIVFGKFYHMQWLPEFPFRILLFFTSGLFLFFAFTYGRKAINYWDEVVKDFQHPIRINFFSAVSISFILLSIAYLSYWPLLSILLWWIGVIVHTFLMLHTIKFWIQQNFEIKFMNPAWFIPVVGNILIPVAGVDFMPKAFSFLYFGIGFFFWIILFAIFLNRVIFHHQLPQKFIPTLFILIAPPAVGFIAYIRIAQSWDTFAVFMLFIAYFFVALLVFLWKSFYKIRFFISWWAFTFPLMAITLASVVAFQVSAVAFYKYMAFILGIVAFAFISYVAWKTIGKVREGEICVNEE